MSGRLLDELQRTGPEPAMLPYAMRHFVSAKSGDRPPAAMREDLLAAGLAQGRVRQAVELLQRDPSVMEPVSLAVLQSGWESERDRDLARGAIGAAQVKLPVVEAVLVAVVGVSGLWLTATKGRKFHQRTIRRGPDGSWKKARRPSGMDRQVRLRQSPKCSGFPPTTTLETRRPSFLMTVNLCCCQAANQTEGHIP
jgi:hypothetical protein